MIQRYISNTYVVARLFSVAAFYYENSILHIKYAIYEWFQASDDLDKTNYFLHKETIEETNTQDLVLPSLFYSEYPFENPCAGK